MNELTLNVNLENLTDTERKALMILVKKANGEKSKIWKPKYGDWVWYVDTGEAKSTQWIECSNWREYLYSIGALFQTKEEAEFHSMQEIMLAKWKRMSIEAGEDENQWDSTHRHWHVVYDYYNHKLILNWVSSLRTSDVCFPTKESLESAISELGEKNVKKYILGIKE